MKVANVAVLLLLFILGVFVLPQGFMYWESWYKGEPRHQPVQVDFEIEVPEFFTESMESTKDDVEAVNKRLDMHEGGIDNAFEGLRDLNQRIYNLQDKVRQLEDMIPPEAPNDNEDAV